MQDMRKLNKKSLCLAAAALTLTAGISAGTAMAYFTTYTEASGGVTLDMGFSETVPKEDFSNWTKHVGIQNTGKEECYIRVKVLTGEKYQDKLTYDDGNNDSLKRVIEGTPTFAEGSWVLGSDGYYYYTGIVAPGEYTNVLDITIQVAEDEKDSFNVVVVQESTKVEYQDGKAKSWSEVDGWNQNADVIETAGE